MPDAPVGTTPFLGLGTWNDGDNPGASALNNNWTLIDEGVSSASADSLTYSLPLQQTDVNVALNIGNNLRLVGNNLETIQNIRITDAPQFTGINIATNSTPTGIMFLPQNDPTFNLTAYYQLYSASAFIVGTDTLISTDLSNQFHVIGNSRLKGQNQFGYESQSLQRITGSLNVSGSVYAQYEMATRRIWINKSLNVIPTGSGQTEVTQSEEEDYPIYGPIGPATPPDDTSLYVSGTVVIDDIFILTGSMTVIDGPISLVSNTEVTGTLKVTSTCESALFSTPVAMYALQQIGVGAYSGDGMFFVEGGDSQFNGNVGVTGSISRNLKTVPAYHGDLNDEPTVDVQPGDTYYNKDSSSVFLYGNATWLQITA